MRIIKVAILGVFISISGFAQQTKTIDIKSFTKVRLLGCVSAELRKSGSESLKISTPGSYENAKITVETKNNELIIRQGWEKDVFKKGDCKSSDIKVDLGYRSLESIYTGVGAELHVAEVIQTRDLDLQAATGSIMRLQADVKNLKAKAMQGAIIEISGKASEQQSSANTGGEIHAFDLQCEDAFVKANTGGIMKVHASERIDASANTGGNIQYRGNPSKRNVSSNLGGEVSKGEK